MTEAARLRATNRKMKILAHQVIIKVMLLHFFLVMSCPYQPLEAGREQLLTYWKNMCAN
jgi:hypothetical protein